VVQVASAMLTCVYCRKVWIKQFWSSRSMAWFREQFCEPSTYYNTLCVVPVNGLPYENETAWCKAYYNRTDCENIRDAAQEQMEIYAYLYCNINGAIGIIFVILVSLNCTRWLMILSAKSINSQTYLCSSRLRCT
jgi:hypothetical protein